MKDVSLISELFEELDLESGLFWLYIETEQEDIPLEFDMPMSRVHHLLLFVNLCEPGNDFKLVVKLRIYSVRQKLSMTGITGPILNCVYQQTLKNYMVRNWFHGYLKSSQIVEVAAIFHIIRTALDDKEYEKLCRVYGFPLEQIIPKKSLSLHSEQEWKLKIESYLNKNAYLKKQKVSVLKRKFLEYLLYSPCYASNIYRYRVHGEGSMVLKNEGILVVSVFGIYLYEESRFKKPKVYVEFEDIQNLEIKPNHVSIEFIEEKT